MRQDEIENNVLHKNKLWLVLKQMKFGDCPTNHFYLKGGEVFKIGRVVLKVLEINEDLEDNNSDSQIRPESREGDTDMSLGEIVAEDQVEEPLELRERNDLQFEEVKED